MNSLLLTVAWLTGPALAACEDRTAQDLMSAVGAAEKAHVTLDVPGLQASAQQAVAAVPCADEVLGRKDAARLHRVVGLDAFTEQQRDLATRAFAAARDADPTYDFPRAVIPEGHPLRTYYTALPLDAGTSQTVSPPSGFVLRLDGVDSHARPLSWPTLAQVVDPGGQVVSTWYLWPEDPLPDTLNSAVTAVKVATEPTPAAPDPITASETAERGGKPLRRVALMSSLAAGGAYVGSWLTLREYNQPGHTDAELDRLFLATNGLTVGAAAFGLVAVGSGVGAFLARRF
jgi:hypothetical protein